MKKIHFVILLVGFLIAATGGWFLASYKPALNLEQYAPLPPGGEFALQSNQGPIKLSDFSGKVVLIYFGYTYCPDICPTSLALISGALKLLSNKERENVQSLFISVDPGRDTVERLAEYANFFDPNILGITGNKAEIDDITKRFGAFYQIYDQGAQNDSSHNGEVIQSGKEKGSAVGYVVDHSSQTVVVGKDGEIKSIIPHGTLPEDMVNYFINYL